MKKKVVILQPVLSHYRKSTFMHILENELFDTFLIAGESYLNIKSFKTEKSVILPFLKISILRHSFFYLKRSMRTLKKINPEIIVAGGIDFHLLHTMLAFFIFKLLKGKQFFWWSHATLGNQGYLGKKSRLFFYKKSDGIMVYNQKGKENLLSIGIPGHKIKVIGNAVNEEDYGYLNHKLEKNYIPDIPFNMVFIGRITSYRRLDILFKALAIIKQKSDLDFSATIIGDGYLDENKELVNQLNLSDHVCFEGAQYGKHAAEFLRKADLLVYPKAIGLSILHSFSFGVPAITTDNMEIQMPEIELLKPGYNGDFYKDENVDDLADKILKWASALKVNKSKYQENCINSIKEYGYLPDVMAKKFVRFLEQKKK